MLKQEEISLCQLSGASFNELEPTEQRLLSLIHLLAYTHTHMSKVLCDNGVQCVCVWRCNCVKMTDVLWVLYASDGVTKKNDEHLCVCECALMYLLNSVQVSISVWPTSLSVCLVSGEDGGDVGWQSWLKDSRPLRVSLCLCDEGRVSVGGCGSYTPQRLPSVFFHVVLRTFALIWCQIQCCNEKIKESLAFLKLFSF